MKINYINQFQRDIIKWGYSQPVLEDVSIEELAEIYTNNNHHDKNLPNWENRQNDFKEGWQQREQQLLPIIKELGEALNLLNNACTMKEKCDSALNTKKLLNKYKNYL